MITRTSRTIYHSNAPLSCIPHLSYCPFTLALRRSYAAAAPSTRRARARQVLQQRATTPHGGALTNNVDERAFLPLLNTLRLARSSGIISIDPQHVLTFLKAYIVLGRDPPVRQVEKLCQEYEIPASSLPDVAQILLRSPHRQHHVIAKYLLLASSSLDVPAATYHLVSEGLKRDLLSQSQLQPAIKHLARLARNEPDNIQAMVLWGRVLLSRDEEVEAMKILRKVVDDDMLERREHANNKKSSSSNNATIIDASRVNAYLALARLSVKHQDPEQARKWYEQAAHIYDAVEAWTYLAEIHSSSSHSHLPHYEYYLLRAAAKGSLDAADQLGSFYRRRWMADNKSDVKLLKWSEEWFNICLAEGVVRNPDDLVRLSNDP